MPRIPGVNHRRAIRALERAGFRVVREGRKHVVMSDGIRFLTIPRNDPINAYTLGGIVTDAGLDVEEFKKLL
jgi:predicted RNA binding protein YcfA (HicA-like mRNA interferase family)